MYKARLRALGLFGLKKGRLGGGSYQWTQMEMQEIAFKHKKKLPMREVKYGNRLPRVVVESLGLDILTT